MPQPLTPSRRRRTKVLHRCAGCGRDLVRSAVRPIKSGRFKGELMHGRTYQLCGPVQWQLNPEYRKQVS